LSASSKPLGYLLSGNSSQFIQWTGFQGIIEASLHAGWVKTHPPMISAEVTLDHGTITPVGRNTRGAGKEAVVAANELVLVHQYRTILRALGDSTGRTDLHTGWTTTVHAAHGVSTTTLGLTLYGTILF
jgi:hypothetical protein